MNTKPTLSRPLRYVTAARRAGLERSATSRTTREVEVGKAKLWAALASMSDAVFIADRDGTFVEFNDAFATFHRFASRAECARTLADYVELLEVFDLAGVRLAAEDWAVPRALRGESVSNLELILKRRDTGESWIASYNLAPIRDLDQVIIGAVVTARDVTEHRRSEAAAQAARRAVEESHRLLALGERIANIGSWHFDAKTGILESSDGIRRIFGVAVLERRQNLARRVRVWHPEDRAAHRACFETALATGEGYVFHGRVVIANGEIRDVSEVAQCQFDSEGRVACVFGVVKDTTETREAERRLAEINERLIAATEAGKVGIWELSCVTGRFVTDQTCRQISQAPDPATEPDPEFWWEIVHPEDRRDVSDEMARCIDGEGFDLEYRLQRADGSTRYVQSRARLIRGSRGEPLRILGTTWDITETRILNDLLRAEKHRAEQANQAKSNFLAMMSHEIRTPMNGVMGMNEMLLGSGLSPQQQLYAETIRDSSVSLLKIIDSILDLSKLEAGKVTPSTAPFDLRDVIERAVTAFTPVAAAKGLALSAEFSHAGPTHFVGDSSLIRQVVLNLLSNAIKFTEAGAVTVAVATTAASDDSHVRIAVSDTGIGIAEEVRGKLFQPFEQADNTVTRRFGGTGLGLSICKRLATVMGGQLDVVPNPGGGSIFRLELDLPRAPATGPVPTQAPAVVPAAPEPVAAAPLPAPRAGHILVVEDNRINALVVGAFLTAGGYSFDLAGDGVEALDALEKSRYDLVLMDVQMPRLDGLSATREIRRRMTAGPHVPIIAMTANAMTEDEARCREAGMDDYMSKPLDTRTVYATIDRWLAVPA